jgi:type IV secretion system protein VirD4
MRSIIAGAGVAGAAVTWGAYARLTDPNSKATAVQDVVETVLSSTRFLDDPRIGADMARGGAIDFGALHREICTIWPILPVHELQAQAKWSRMFVNCALRGLYKSPPTSGATLPPVLFLMEEFGHIGRLQEVVKALGAARDYSIQMAFVLQSLSQLRAHYEKEVDLFFCGSGAVSSFAPRDWQTAEQLSKMFGNRMEMVQTETNNGGSLTPQAVPLVRPEDLMRLKWGQTVNLIEPCPWPVLADVPVYPHTPYAAGLDPNPYYRG